MIRFRACALAALALAASLAMPQRAGAAIELESFAGHLSVGYASLSARNSGGGSLSVAGGIEYPLTAQWLAGLDLGFHLLGSNTAQRGSEFANVDYSAFDAAAVVHWLPGFRGPIERFSLGGGIGSARADLSTAGGGAAFSDLAVDEVKPELAFGTTLMSRKPSAVRMGLELGTRLILIPRNLWTITSARLTFHY